MSIIAPVRMMVDPSSLTSSHTVNYHGLLYRVIDVLETEILGGYSVTAMRADGSRCSPYYAENNAAELVAVG